MATTDQRRADFLRLHESGFFILPNAWDVGSAVRLAKLGFKAIASTSSGAAWAMGKEDGELSRDEVLAHLRMLVDATDLPVNADFENGFADDPKDVVATMTKFLGVDQAAVMRSLNTFYPVPAKEQATKRWFGRPGDKDSGVVKTLQSQAQFLFESQQIVAVPKDVSSFVDGSFVAKLAA